MRRPALLCLVAGLSGVTDAFADPPCAGCVLEGAGDQARPILVLLHGDEGEPRRLARAWRATAAAHGFTLFAPKCPRELGCASGSFWRWGKDPAWLFALLDRVEAQHPVAAGKRYLAGWSGGASYMGMFAERWPSRFAATSFAGGGVPPADPKDSAGQGLGAPPPVTSQGPTACGSPGPRTGAPPGCCPVHYLAGDRNPLFHLEAQTRAHLEGCGHTLTWALQRGADHDGEWRAYEKNLDEIARFFERSPGACAAPARLERTPAVPASTEAGSPPAAAGAPPGPPAEPPAARGGGARGCGCSAPSEGAATSAPLTLAAGLALRLLRRRRATSMLAPA